MAREFDWSIRSHKISARELNKDLLISNKYRQRIVKDKTKYTRKIKHKGSQHV